MRLQGGTRYINTSQTSSACSSNSTHVRCTIHRAIAGTSVPAAHVKYSLIARDQALAPGELVRGDIARARTFSQRVNSSTSWKSYFGGGHALKSRYVRHRIARTGDTKRGPLTRCTRLHAFIRDYAAIRLQPDKLERADTRALLPGSRLCAFRVCGPKLSVELTPHTSRRDPPHAYAPFPPQPNVLCARAPYFTCTPDFPKYFPYLSAMLWHPCFENICLA